MANVGVLGAGSWGTALSVLLSDNGHQVTVWSIDENEVKMLNEKISLCLQFLRLLREARHRRCLLLWLKARSLWMWQKE